MKDFTPRSIYGFLLVTGLTVFPLLGQTAELACRDLFKAKSEVSKVLQESFNDRNIYNPNACAGNVGRLLERLKVIDHLEDYQVMFLLYEKGYSAGVPRNLKLTPSNVRDGFRAWNYHTVLVSKN